MKTCKSHLSTRPLAAAAAAVALVVLMAATPALAQKKGGVSPILPGGNSRAPVSVDAAKLEYFDKEQKLVYSGGVVAKQGEATLRASTLVVLLSKEETPAEGAAPAAGAEGSQIRRIEAAGPVTITSADQVGTGERGVYDRGENKVYLIGNVVLSQGPNITKGDRDSRLIYDLTSGQAQVVGGRVSSIFTPGSSDDRKRPAGR
jgi:lipopolysaccharide export system protein LptA